MCFWSAVEVNHVMIKGDLIMECVLSVRLLENVHLMSRFMDNKVFELTV